MRNLLLIVVMSSVLSTLSYGATTAQNATDFVNTQITEMVEILNLSLTKLNITSCASIAVGRANDSFTVAMPANWANEAQANPAYRLIIVHETPVKTGMDRRIKIYTEASAVLADAPVVDLAHLGAIVEFTCDDANTANRMKKGYLVQTGTSNELLEANWDNTTVTPSVQFRLVGLDNTNAVADVTFIKNDSMSFTSGAQTMVYTNLTTYLHDFGVNYRGPTCHSNASTDHTTLSGLGCEINN